MYVYLIGSSDGYCKIGMASNPAFRIAQLDSTKLPFEMRLKAQLECGDAAKFVERRLHKYFQSKHRRGEWFVGVTTEEFLRKAQEFVKEWVPPKPRLSRPDPYEGTPWGELSSQQRCKFMRVAAIVPDDIAEEMHAYAHTKAESPEQLKKLLSLVYLGMTFDEKTFQAV